MTAERGGRLPEPEPAAEESDSGTLPLEAILSLCDRLLKEPGRRRHLFAWLRAPGAGPEEWLAVDAYYPARRVVVVWDPHNRPHGHLYEELVPQHALRLLEIDPDQLGGDLAAAKQTLERMIATLAPVMPTAIAPQPRRTESAAARSAESAGARSTKTGTARRTLSVPRPRRTMTEALAALARAPAQEAASPAPAGPRRQAVARAARHIGGSEARILQLPARRRPLARQVLGPTVRGPRSAVPAEASSPVAMATLAVTLMLVLGAEMYLDVVKIAVDSSLILLAFGIALDACARGLGTIAAARAGTQAWAWACLLGGTPVVAAFALRSSEEPPVEPAPLAALLSLLAGLIVAIALLAQALSS
jgi:hypothetical protein